VGTRHLQLPNETGRCGDVYTLQRWAWNEQKKNTTFCFNDGAKAVDQDDFGLVLSAVEGEVVEGTGRHSERAGAADLIEGQGSDNAQMSSTNA
jgi:hypothetical protein